MTYEEMLAKAQHTASLKKHANDDRYRMIVVSKEGKAKQTQSWHDADRDKGIREYVRLINRRGTTDKVALLDVHGGRLLYWTP